MVGRGNSTCEGFELGKSLVSVQNRKFILDRESVKNDMRFIQRSEQGLDECSMIGRYVLVFGFCCGLVLEGFMEGEE